MLLEFLRFLEELDDLLQLFFRFIYAGDVLERHFFLRARRKLGFALAERQRLVTAALHLTHEEQPEADNEQSRRPSEQQRRPRAGGRLLRIDLHVGLHQLVDEAVVLRWHVCVKCFVRLRGASEVLTDDFDFGYAARPDPRHELAEAHTPFGPLEPSGNIPNQQPHNEERSPEQQTLQRRVHFDEPPKTRQVVRPA
jgi:hypothetical protein